MNAGCGFLSALEVEAAIDGRLDERRRDEFEHHIEAGCAECVTLAADLEVFQQVTRDGVLERERREADRQAEMLRVRLAREVRKAPSGASWRGWAVAAAAVLLAGIVWIGVRGPTVPDGFSIQLPGGEQFVAEAKPFHTPPVLRGDRSFEDVWRDVETAYARGRYSAAEQHLVSILERRPDLFDAVVYHGVCQLALERPAEASASFERARRLAAEQDLSTESLAWFQALAALAEDRTAAAEAFLEEAAAGTGLYADKAHDLLARLRG